MSIFGTHHLRNHIGWKNPYVLSRSDVLQYFANLGFPGDGTYGPKYIVNQPYLSHFNSVDRSRAEPCMLPNPFLKSARHREATLNELT